MARTKEGYTQRRYELIAGTISELYYSMPFTQEQIKSYIKENYDLTVDIRLLPGEIDLNYHAETADQKSFIFKIADADEKPENLQLQNAMMAHLAGKKLNLSVSSIVLSNGGLPILSIADSDGSKRWTRLLTWVPGRVLAKVNPHRPALMESLGEMCGNLCQALADFDHPAAHRFMKWNPAENHFAKEFYNDPRVITRAGLPAGLAGK